MEVIRERNVQANKNDFNYLESDRRDYDYRPRRNDSDLVIKIIIGFVLGGGSLFLMIASAKQLLDPYQRVQTVNDQLQVTSAIVSSSIREMANIQAETAINRKRELARIEVEKARELERIRQVEKLEQEKKIKKDMAFKQFYKKSEKCLGPKLWSEKVACGNEFMRAQSEFERVYKD